MNLLLFKPYYLLDEPDELIATFEKVYNQASFGGLISIDTRTAVIHSYEPIIANKAEYVQYEENNLISTKLGVHERSIYTFKLDPKYYWKIVEPA